MNLVWCFETTIIMSMFYSCIVANFSPPKNKGQKRLNECGSCKLISKSFQHWLQKTSRGKFEGGDADWEENKLKSYSRSEVRLVEIQEGLCSELTAHKDQCYALAENSESLIEKWWSTKDPDDAHLFSWLCVDNLAVCCAPRQYGPMCAPCTECGANARCDGEGTRRGTGQCVCSHGWRMVDGKCEAINACNADTCAPGQYCVNAKGKRECLQCDKSCLTCSGAGQRACIECAPHYTPSFSGACIYTDIGHILPVVMFSNFMMYVLPLLFMFLLIMSKFCKSRYLYFFIFQVVFIIFHYYSGFTHLMLEYIYDILEYTNIRKIWS